MGEVFATLARSSLIASGDGRLLVVDISTDVSLETRFGWVVRVRSAWSQSILRRIVEVVGCACGEVVRNVEVRSFAYLYIERAVSKATGECSRTDTHSAGAFAAFL